jgi:hypothetical protein
MKLFRIFLISIFFISLAGTTMYSQDVLKKKKSGESRYILRDSTGSYLIKETTSPDGTKSYSLIPKSYLEDTLGVEKRIPQSLQDWFYKNKKRNRASSIVASDEKDSLSYLLAKDSRDTTAAADQKKNKAAWWIVGSTTIVGGVVAYIFLKYRKGVEELPIQPDSPK